MLIGLHGKKQAGKDTVFQRAAHIMRDVAVVERRSFADKLYESAAASLYVPVEFLQRWKADPDAYIWAGSVGHPVRQSIRSYLQRYGTEAHRAVFGDDFWVEQVDLDDHSNRIVMVTDVRFENEARAVKRAGGFVVRVVGPPSIENDGDGHASETPLSEGLVDFTLNNQIRHDNFRRLDGVVDTLLRQVLRLDVARREPVGAYPREDFS